ncbi:MAG: putative porin [Bacteroidetes bacterium]|uniref:Porin n=1 Tax=Candidatus Cryptobacteroides excrementipullorum TaxID=2840761 RepID=A0A9D9NMA9_9BACT|nr:putative porin [Candidatus Cryptobacteroides excrementipullorum]
MKDLLSKIWIPALLIGIAAVQSFGIDTARSRRIATLADSLGKHSGNDSSIIMESIDSEAITTSDSILFIHSNPGLASVVRDLSSRIDSINALTARDTIIPPDSLRYTDSLRFRFYVELHDAPTRASTRDSLMAAGDTLQLHLLDSLFRKDSTETAVRDSLIWFNSLSRKEQKKVISAQNLPILMARMDSILNRRDSIIAARDSIIAATPRILETYAVPDSMQYKRLITWTHDRYFNNVELHSQDTTYNYHFYDYSFYKEDTEVSYLGVIGSPVQTYNFFKREEEENVVFYTPYRIYNYSPESLPMYNTKTPYTELAYWGTLFANQEKEETNIKVLTTQNILPELNVTLEYHRYGGNGMLRREDVDNRTFVAATNYLGKRYLMHAGYIYNRVEKSENGGIVDNTWIRDTTVDAREIEVHLQNASNKIKKNTVFLDQSYRIPFSFIDNLGHRKERRAEKARRDSIMASGDTTAINALLAMDKEKEALEAEASDSLERDITTAFIGHSSEYSVFTKLYTDEIASGEDGQYGRQLYNDRFYLNPTTSADSQRVMKFENRLYIRLQPWSEDGIVSKLDVGIGDKLLNYYDFSSTQNYLSKGRNVVRNSVYMYAGAQGQFKKFLRWDAVGRYTFLGAEANDFGVDANLNFNIFPFRKNRTSPISFNASFSTSLKEPDWYQQHYLSNHYKWDNSFGKISETKVEASAAIPLWKLKASFGYALLSNNIYYDTDGIVRQNSTPMSVMTASLVKNFRLWKFHFDHQALFQLSSNTDVLPLPTLALNFRYYLQFDVKKNVMQMQLGANAWYTTRWYAPAYSPALGLFHNQTEEQYGNSPYIDAFVNIQWKRACIFVKVVNVGMGWPENPVDYFSAHHYIRPQRAIKFGIFWPFYVQSGKKSAVEGPAAGTGGKGASKSASR